MINNKRIKIIKKNTENVISKNLKRAINALITTAQALECLAARLEENETA